MKAFGLTGGIGMGKSTAAEILARRGVAVVDTDVVARQVVEPGEPALEEIKQQFGSEFVDEHGRLRREGLARRVFGEEAARRQLETILHPRIRRIWTAQLETWRAAGRSVGVVVIPLLFETDAAAYFDATICVACSSATQQQRLLARGWNAEQLQQRLQAQWPIVKKMALANFVVWTEGSVGVHAAQLERIIPASQTKPA